MAASAPGHVLCVSVHERCSFLLSLGASGSQSGGELRDELDRGKPRLARLGSALVHPPRHLVTVFNVASATQGSSASIALIRPFASARKPR